MYYVYAYLREDNTPYYIGKGKGNRIYNKNHCVNLPTNKSKIIILENDLTEIGAFALERRMIFWYGRIDLNNGILRNKTDGGDGASGYVHTNESKELIGKKTKGNKSRTGLKHSSETKKIISLANSGKNSYMFGEKPWNYGQKTKQETRKKQSEKRKSLINVKELSGNAGKISQEKYKNDPIRQQAHKERMKLWWKERKEQVKQNVKF